MLQLKVGLATVCYKNGLVTNIKMKKILSYIDGLASHSQYVLGKPLAGVCLDYWVETRPNQHIPCLEKIRGVIIAVQNGVFT